VFERAIQRLEHMRGEADDAVQKLLTGQGGELHTIALAAQRAEIAFDLGLQVRNKIVSAYQEVMRMQL
jgi:flagellar hook-basal body complex protein FliE